MLICVLVLLGIGRMVFLESSATSKALSYIVHSLKEFGFL